MALPKSNNALDMHFLSVPGSSSEVEYASRQNTGVKKLSYPTEQDIKALYEKHFNPLCVHITEKLGDPELAKDMVADVFAKLMQEGTDRVPDYKLESHLFMVIEQKCSDYLKRHPLIDKSISPVDIITPTNDTAAIEAEITALIYDELSKLPPKRRQIVIQLYMKGLTSQQVAKRMKLSRQTVLNQKIRALKVLRDNILRRLF